MIPFEHHYWKLNLSFFTTPLPDEYQQYVSDYKLNGEIRWPVFSDNQVSFYTLALFRAVMAAQPGDVECHNIKEPEFDFNGFGILYYKKAYEAGQREFQKYLPDPQMLYGQGGEDKVLTLEKLYFESEIRDTVYRGWKFVRMGLPEILSVKVMESYARYTGIVNKLAEIIQAEPGPFSRSKLKSEFPIYKPSIVGLDNQMIDKQLRAFTEAVNKQIRIEEQSRLDSLGSKYKVPFPYWVLKRHKQHFEQPSPQSLPQVKDLDGQYIETPSIWIWAILESRSNGNHILGVNVKTNETKPIEGKHWLRVYSDGYYSGQKKCPDPRDPKFLNQPNYFRAALEKLYEDHRWIWSTFFSQLTIDGLKQLGEATGLIVKIANIVEEDVISFKGSPLLELIGQVPEPTQTPTATLEQETDAEATLKGLTPRQLAVLFNCLNTLSEGKLFPSENATAKSEFIAKVCGKDNAAKERIRGCINGPFKTVQKTESIENQLKPLKDLAARIGSVDLERLIDTYK